MPSLTIPLVGAYNQRGTDYDQEVTDGNDQQFKNCFIRTKTSPVVGATNLYIEKFPKNTNVFNDGVSITSLLATSIGGIAYLINIASSTVYASSASGSININCGTIGTIGNHITETTISSKKYFLISDGDGTGWFLWEDAITVAKDTTRTGTTTSGSAIVTSVSTTASLAAGMAVSGTGIPANTVISTIDSGTQITLNNNATASNSGVTLTFVSNVFVADATSGSAVLTNVTSTTGLVIGQAISGTGIAAGARILTIDSGTQVTMTANATASNTGIVVTWERVAKIIDSDFPTSIIGPFAQMDGYSFVMTSNGRIYNSDLNSITSWTAGNYITATMLPDDASGGVWRHKNMLVAFGQSSIEFFYNAGNASGSPLSGSSQLFSNIGAFCSTGIAPFDDTIYFISTSPTVGGVAIYRLNGFTPERLDSESINLLIGSLSLTQIYLSGAVIAGRRFLFVYQPGYAIDLENMFMFRYEQNITRASGLFISNSASGDVYFASSISPQVGVSRIKNANPDYSLTLTIQTSKLNFGTEARKFISKVSLLGSDIQASGTATLEFSDDDYATWTTVGTFDMTKINPFITRCGSNQGGRAWRLTHSANTAFRAQALKFEYEVGAH